MTGQDCECILILANDSDSDLNAESITGEMRIFDELLNDIQYSIIV